MPRRPPDILRKSHAHTEGKIRASDKRALELELDQSLHGDERVLLLSIDGFVFDQGQLLPGAVETVAWLGQQGIVHLFVAGPGSGPFSALIDKLAGAGIEVVDDQILTPEAANRMVEQGRAIAVATIAELSSKLGDR